MRMDERVPLRGEEAYHVQIRRLQAALRQSSWQHRASTCSDAPQPTPAVCSFLSEGSTSRRTSPPQRLPLRERSPNQISGGEDRKKRAAVASLFSTAVVADDPFDDLIARAWGEGETRGVATAQKPLAVPPPRPSSSSFSIAPPAACQSALGVVRVPTNTPSTSTGASSCAGVCESATLCGSNAKGNDAGGAACTFSATSGHPAASLSLRGSRKAADTRCRLTSVVAASQRAAHSPQDNTQHHPPATSNHFNSTPSGAASLSHASARTQPISCTPLQRSRRHRTTANAATTSERGRAGVARGGGGSGAHLSMPQQQRLLSRIQLLDRVIECNRGGRRSAHAAQLLQQVKKEDNEPYFSVGPVEWTAVCRLRERLVGELLGTSSAARETTPSQPPPPPHHSPSSSPSVCHTAWTGAGTSLSCARGEAQEDALPTRATSCSFSLSPPRSLVAPTEVCGASTRAAVSPCAAPSPTHVSVESVDPYAESRAAFQKEIEAMRRTQALRMRNSRSSGGTRMLSDTA